MHGNLTMMVTIYMVSKSCVIHFFSKTITDSEKIKARILTNIFGMLTIFYILY